MNAVTLINQLAANDIRLWLDQGQLRYSAPEGAMTADIISTLRQHKDALIHFLQQSESARDNAIPSADLQQPIPASFAQQRLWFMQQLEPDNSAFHIHTTLQIHGDLQVQLLEQACQQIIQRHAVLRTSYYQQNGLLFQRIHDVAEWHIRQQTLDENAVQTAIHDELHRPFDLSQVPPLRCALLHIGQQHHIACFTVHHIAADGWSLGIFVQELMQAYQAQVQNQSAELPALPRQYADFAAWQTSSEQQQRLQQQLQFWQQQLAGVPNLDLPLSYIRTPTTDNRAQQVQRRIRSDAVQALTRRYNTTLFVSMMALLSALLQRYSQQSDFCIGTPVAGRPASVLEPLIGCFINVLAIRCEPQPRQSFSEHLLAVKATCENALQHQDVPFEQVVQALDLPRDMSITPLFQVMLSIQNTPFSHSAIAGLDIDAWPDAEHAAQFDLQLTIQEQQDELLLAFDYKQALFDDALIAQMADHFVALCHAACAQPEQALHALNLFPQLSAQQALAQSSGGLNSQTDHRQATVLLADRLAQQAAKTPDAIAVIHGQQSLSYQQLHQQAGQLAQLLQRQGVSPGDRIGICLNRRLEVLPALLAVIYSGACYIPMDAAYPAERLAYMLDDADMKRVITEDALLDKLPATANRLLSVDNADWRTLPPAAAVASHGDDILYMIYTSGSTGQPKAASVYQHSFANLLHWYITEYGLSANDRSLIISALGFDLTQKNLFALLCCGGTLVLPDSDHYDVGHYRALIRQHRISMLNCAPSAFYPLLDNSTSATAFADLSSLRLLLFGGEAIQLHTLRPWIQSPGFHCTLVNMYGPTECTDITTAFSLKAEALQQWPDHQPLPLGRPITGVSLYILDEQLQPVPPGLTGELYIAGSSVGAGYWQRPELTASHFLSNPFSHHANDQVLYKTGDRVRLSVSAGEPRLLYQGRNDFQMKIRGLRIEAGEIEQTLNSLPDVADSHILLDGEQLLAFVRMHPADASPPADWRAVLQQRIPAYMLPAMLIAVPQWPLTPNGKIDRNALLALDRPQRSTQFVAPATDTEQRLAAIWQSVLQVDAIGIHDSFFDLGGHSLTAAQALALAQQEFAAELPLRQLFENPTIAAIAALIDQHLLAQKILADDAVDEDSESFIL